MQHWEDREPEGRAILSLNEITRNVSATRHNPYRHHRSIMAPRTWHILTDIKSKPVMLWGCWGSMVGRGDVTVSAWSLPGDPPLLFSWWWLSPGSHERLAWASVNARACRVSWRLRKCKMKGFVAQGSNLQLVSLPLSRRMLLTGTLEDNGWLLPWPTAERGVKRGSGIRIEKLLYGSQTPTHTGTFSALVYKAVVHRKTSSYN